MILMFVAIKMAVFKYHFLFVCFAMIPSLSRSQRQDSNLRLQNLPRKYNLSSV